MSNVKPVSRSKTGALDHTHSDPEHLHWQEQKKSPDHDLSLPHIMSPSLES